MITPNSTIRQWQRIYDASADNSDDLPIDRAIKLRLREVLVWRIAKAKAERPPSIR